MQKVCIYSPEQNRKSMFAISEHHKKEITKRENFVARVTMPKNRKIIRQCTKIWQKKNTVVFAA